MEQVEFEQVCQRIRQTGAPLEAIQEAFSSISPLTIEGIYYRVRQIDGRKSIWDFDRRQKSAQQVWNEFETLWLAGPTEDVIVGMSETYGGVPPCYLARQIVRGYAEAMNEQARLEWSAQKEVSIVVDSDDLEVAAKANEATELTEVVEVAGVAKVVGEESTSLPPEALKAKFTSVSYPKKLNYVRIYREPSAIPHAGLARNVSNCHRVDQHYSPAMDEYRTLIGKEYEDKLGSALDALGIPHLNETAMRRLKYARTPDAVLLEPIAIDGMVVKWIESKAWFGDPAAHYSYLRDQYWPYYNRFGPGLVIYWFGFVREATDAHKHQGIMVMDGFPSITRITRLASPHLKLVIQASQVGHENNTYALDKGETHKGQSGTGCGALDQ